MIYLTYYLLLIQRRLLSSYEIDQEEDDAFDVTDSILGSETEDAA